MSAISLSALDLSFAALLLAALAVLSFLMSLGLARSLLIAGLRTTVHRRLIGMGLK